MYKSVLVLMLGLGLAACGGGSVTGPSGSTFPQVSGNYSGSLTFAQPERGLSLNCPASTVVNQSGGNVSIAPIVLGGQCGGVSIPVGDGSIDSNGSLGSGSGTSNDPDCGTYNYTASGGFFGREFRLSINTTSLTCWNTNVSGTLSR